MASKGFACLQNKFFRYFIPFLLNSGLKQTNILMGSWICFVFLNTPYSAIKGIKSCLTDVLTVFS